MFRKNVHEFKTKRFFMDEVGIVSYVPISSKSEGNISLDAQSVFHLSIGVQRVISVLMWEYD